MFKSIRFKLTFYFFLLLAVVLLGTSYLLYKQAKANKISSIDGSLYVIVNDMIMETEETMAENNIAELSEDVREIHDKFTLGNLYLRIVHYDIKSDKQSIVTKTKNNIFLFKDFDFKNNLTLDTVIYSTNSNYRIASKLFKIEGKGIFLAQAIVLISVKNNSILTLMIVNIIILFFATFGSYILISRILLSVHSVVEDVNKIKGDDYKTRLLADNIPNEIKELVDTFNRLLARHEESFSKISQFSSDVSHELKTPLTSMRGEMEVGLRRERSSKEYQKILEKSLDNLTEIEELIDGLLFLAKSDKLKISSFFEEVYVDEIISECIEDLKTVANKKSIKIEVALVPLTIRGNAKLLKIACINILKNAILYSPASTKIKTEIIENDSEFIISFQDQGVGISKEELKHIFDRFYRASKIKLLTSGGTGLGLSIVKMILDIHDFNISVESEVNRGTVVKIFIKKAKTLAIPFDI